MAEFEDKKISELERLTGDLTPQSLFETAYTDDQREEGTYDTRAVNVEQLGRTVLNDIEYATELDTDDKTIFGAINELAQGGGGGSNVTVTPKLTEGTNIATITVNGDDVELYAPNSGSNVTMEDNDIAGVDLTVEDVTRTLVKQEDFNDIDTLVGSHESRITNVESDVIALDKHVTSGYVAEKNYIDNKSTFNNSSNPIRNDDQSVLSLEPVTVEGGIVIKHLLGYRYFGFENSMIVELDENKQFVYPRSLNNNRTANEEKTITLQANTRYLYIPCLKTYKDIGYVKREDGSLVWKPMGGETIKGIVELTSASNDHDTRIEALEETGSDVTDVQINGTSILDTNKVANIPVASENTIGAVKTSAYGFGIGVNTAGQIYINRANNTQINDRSVYPPITAGNLDYAVKQAMCDGKGAEWNSTEQNLARKRIGLDMFSGKYTAKRDATFTNLIQLVVGGVNANSRVFVTPTTTLPTNGFITRVSLGANVVQIVLNTAFAENTDYTFMVLVDNT